MVKWNAFVAEDFEWDESIENKLSQHGVTFEEVIECFGNPFQIRKNKRFEDRFQLLGQTNAGRKLKIIFQIKPDHVVRIITGWDR